MDVAMAFQVFSLEVATVIDLYKEKDERLKDSGGGKKSFGLKNAHKLTHHHLNPKFYQKMNVAMAFQVFSLEVATVIDLYKEKDERLKDSGPTIAFIKRINKVIVAMTSRSPIEALKPDSESSKTISDFQEYLEEWHDKALENDWKFLSPGTYQGFQLTLKSTIGVTTYLTENCGYEYLMTSRLNQDALESMFGMYRDARGSPGSSAVHSNIQIDELLFTR